MNDRAFTSYHFSIVKVLPTARARFYLLQLLSSRFFDIKPPMFRQHRPSLPSTLSGPGPSTQKGLQFLPIFPVGRDRPVSQFRESYSSPFMRICQGAVRANFAGLRAKPSFFKQQAVIIHLPFSLSRDLGKFVWPFFNQFWNQIPGLYVFNTCFP